MLSMKYRIMWFILAIGIVVIQVYLISSNPFDSGITAVIIAVLFALFLLACTFAFDKYAWHRMMNENDGKANRTKVKNKEIYNNAYEYERYVANRLLKNGKFSEAIMTQKSGDYGADIICRDKKGRKWAVQCKMYSYPVGYRAIQEVISGMHYYNCQFGMVVTTSTFTNQATNAARKMGIELIPNFK